MKIISILPFPSPQGSRVDIFADGFHARIAQQIQGRTQKYQLECWRMEQKLKKVIVDKKDGIVYRAFPSFRPSLGSLNMPLWNAALKTFPYARRVGFDGYSLPMLKELKRECRDGKVLVQFNGPFSPMACLVSLCCRNVPLVFAHTGGPPMTYSPLTFITRLPFSLIERKAMSYADRTLFQSRWIYDRLSKMFPNATLLCPWGVDFEKFKPMDKRKARKLLGIPPGKKVLLYVGHLDSIKGADLTLKVFEELKAKYDVELLLVGGQKGDALYGKAIESGATVRGWVPQSELVPYYSASDVYLLTKFWAKREAASLEEFMAIGLTQIEAMGCKTPSVGTNLNHLLCNEEELKGVGMIPKSPDDVARCIVEVLEHPERYRNCREIAESYYGWGGIVKRLVDIYDELFQEYYGRIK